MNLGYSGTCFFLGGVLFSLLAEYVVISSMIHSHDGLIRHYGLDI